MKYVKDDIRTATIAMLCVKHDYSTLRGLLNLPKGFVSCKDCACCGCAHLDCDIRDKCSECRPMVLLFCSEFKPSDGGAVAL
jgi:hypothetical protein